MKTYIRLLKVLFACFALLEGAVLSLPSIPSKCASAHKEWAAWSGWSLCSTSCGTNGMRMRYRLCVLKSQKKCVHAVDQHKEKCNRFPCPTNHNDYYDVTHKDLSLCLLYIPVNGSWSEWTSVSQCTQKCTGGIITSVRHCNKPAPMYCGHHCGSNNIQFTNCSKFLSYDKMKQLRKVDDQATLVVITNPLSVMKGTKNLYISTNGLISVGKENNQYVNFENIPTNYIQPVVLVYAIDINPSKGGAIYYQQSVTKSVSEQVDALVNEMWRKNNKPANFLMTSSLMVTYENVRLHSLNGTLNFQVTLASDGTNTFGVFIYGHLDQPGGVIGYYNESCKVIKKFFNSTVSTKEILEGSNIGIAGTYVYPLSCD